MKIKALLLSFCFVAVAYADTNTSRAGLVKPSIGTTGWGTKTNTNWDIADSSFSVLNATETFTAAKTFTNPVTMSSSETVTGNFGVSGVVNHSLTVTSSVTVSGNAGLTGAVTLGGAGNSVTISSTTLLPGASFYFGAYPAIGSNTFNAAGYLIGGIASVTQGQITASSTTATTAFVKTGLSVTFTPKATTHKVLLLVTGGLESTTNSDVAEVTIERNVSNLANSDGFTQVSMVTNNGIWGSAAMVYLDSPSSVSSLTYEVYFRNATGARSVIFNPVSGTANLIAIELAQ